MPSLLDEMPELEPLLFDRAVREAVTRGDRHRLYRALWWARLLGRLPAHRALLNALLSERRRFIVPLERPPRLARWNRIGTAFRGHSERDPKDQTHVATHVVEVLAVPLWALGAYLVRAQEGQRYEVFGRVPLGTFCWLYNRLLLLSMLLTTLVTSYVLVHREQLQTVYLVSALPEAIDVHVGARTVRVVPEQPVALTLPVGRYSVSLSTPDGRLEDGEWNLLATTDVQLWNILGAAPLVEQHIDYRAAAESAQGPSSVATPDTTNARQEPVVHCGERALRMAPVDDWFALPPQVVRMPEQQRVVRRRALQLARGGYRACLRFLSQRDPPAGVVTLASAVLEATHYDPASLHALQSSALDGELLLPLLRRSVALHPQSILAHRAYQDVMRQQGFGDAVRTEYKERYARTPDAPDAAYLAMRLGRSVGGPGGFASLVRRFPKHPWIVRASAWEQYAQGDCVQALASYERLRALDGARYDDAATEIAVCMCATGHVEEGLQRLVASFRHLDELTDRCNAAVLYGKLAMRFGGEPTKLLQELGELAPDTHAWLRVRVGLPLTEAELRAVSPSLRRVIELDQALMSDGPRALEALARLTEKERAALTFDSWLLLYGLARTGDAPVAASMRRSYAGRQSIDDIERVLDGAGALEDLEFGPSTRAIFHFLRARSPGVAEAERAALLEQIKREDVLAGPASRALETWAK